MANVIICFVREVFVVLQSYVLHSYVQNARHMTARGHSIRKAPHACCIHSVAAVGIVGRHVHPLQHSSAGDGISSDYHDSVHVQVLLSSPLVITSQAQPLTVPTLNPQPAGNPSSSPQLEKMGLSRSGRQPQLSASTSRRVLQTQLGETTSIWP